jgi:hypothetical protein
MNHYFALTISEKATLQWLGMLLLVASYYIVVYKILWSKPNKIHTPVLRFLTNIALAVFAGLFLYGILMFGNYITSR